MRTTKRLIVLARKGHRFRDWYKRAGHSIEYVCTFKQWDRERFIDILAITSPRVAVRRCVRVAMHYMNTGRFLPATIYGTRSAMAYYEATGLIRGPKTRPFAAALRGDPDAIVLDTWMAKAFEINQTLLSRKSTREECCKRLRQVAKILGWPVAECQAAIWAATLIEHGRHPKHLNAVDELSLFD